MIAVIFEVRPKPDRKGEYLDIAASLRPLLDCIDGFISIERFESLTEPGKILSLSFWRDEESVAQWRNLQDHRTAQVRGREQVFEDYRLRARSRNEHSGESGAVQSLPAPCVSEMIRPVCSHRPTSPSHPGGTLIRSRTSHWTPQLAMQCHD